MSPSIASHGYAALAVTTRSTEILAFGSELASPRCLAVEWSRLIPAAWREPLPGASATGAIAMRTTAAVRARLLVAAVTGHPGC